MSYGGDRIDVGIVTTYDGSGMSAAQAQMGETVAASQAMAAKKYPRLGVPIIVKSKQEDTSPDTIGQIAHTIAESAHQAHVPAKDEAKLLTDQANYPEHLNTKLMTILKKKSRA